MEKIYNMENDEAIMENYKAIWNFFLLFSTE